jgi:hypothetical protein
MVHPKVKPGPRANYRQQLTFCPDDPAKSILVPAAEQQGPLSFEGSRSITPPFSQRRENKCPIKKRLTRRLAATVGSSFCSFAVPESLLAENIDENSHK